MKSKKDNTKLLFFSYFLPIAQLQNEKFVKYVHRCFSESKEDGELQRFH